MKTSRTRGDGALHSLKIQIQAMYVHISIGPKPLKLYVNLMSKRALRDLKTCEIVYYYSLQESRLQLLLHLHEQILYYRFVLNKGKVYIVSIIQLNTFSESKIPDNLCRVNLACKYTKICYV